jgi:hypothetical protein
MTAIYIPGLGDGFIIGPTAMVLEIESRKQRFYYNSKTELAILIDTALPSISTTSTPLKVGTYMLPTERGELNEILDHWHVNKTVKFHLSTGDKITVLGVFK